MDLATRRVHVAGITRNPSERWMMQIAKSLTDPFDGFLRDTRLLNIDRDAKYSAAFRDLLRTSDAQPVRLPARSPSLNAYAERFVRSIKTECTDRVIFFGERSLRHAIDEDIEHYNEERPHQSVGNRPITLDPESPPAIAVVCRERLDGLLRSYTGVAA